jgi:hypothetical protein
VQLAASDLLHWLIKIQHDRQLRDCVLRIMSWLDVKQALPQFWQLCRAISVAAV